ncbi:MAG: hypothetical protein PHN57_00250 [Candidatus Omnitrophica bacterium]|nr:hypothetical protein [Candidatus Omnitrophota bacterium]
MKIKNSRRKGLSLVEVCLAMAILVTIVAVMAHSINEGYSYLRKTRLLTIGQFLAQEAMEENCTWPAVAAARAAVPGFSGFDRQITVVTPALGYNDLAQVQVSVYWQGDKGEQSFVLKTYVANF